MADDANILASSACKYCEYCEKKVINKVKCMSCGAVFHKSCYSRKKCCNKQDISKDIQVNITYDDNDAGNTNENPMESLKYENKLLNELNSELKLTNNLLKEKILTLEEKLNCLKSSMVKTSENLATSKEERNSEFMKNLIQEEVQSYFRKLKNNESHCDIMNVNAHYILGNSNKEIQKTPTSSRKNKNKKDQQKTSNQLSKQQAQKNVNLTDMEEKQRQIMQGIINLEEKNEQTLLNNNNKSSPLPTTNTLLEIKLNEAEEKNTAPMYSDILKSRKTKAITAIQIGDGSTDVGFEGVQKRIWIFLSRVKPQVTAEIISKYLNNKPNMKDRTVIVEELQLKRTRTKAFKVGLDYALKDDAYNPKFWPKGVGFCRYTFSKNNQDDNDQEWEQPTTIQENF